MHRLVTRYVDQQKDELLSHLWAMNAIAPERAIDLSTFPVKRSILQDMINRKIVLKASPGKFYLDPSRMDRAHGASGRFLMYAFAFMILFVVVLALI
jgi:hypothetical protein